ncbi:MAG: acetyl-CoA carboxylase [Candidatus Limnocylindrales bacterium]
MAQRGRPAGDAEVAELVSLIDRLEAILAASAISELEVEVGETALVLRKPVALAAPAGSAVPSEPPAEAASSHHRVLAPLTGLFYISPSPDAAPYVEVGREVSQGQVIGLIEAMKLFNEIKTDVRGRVVRILAINGALIKARQPILEIEPS